MGDIMNSQLNSIQGNSTTTVTQELNQPSSSSVNLNLQKPNKQRKKVGWTSETVDNENLNKKKSKCCCIYTPQPKTFDESSEESDGECENCYGHKDKKKEDKDDKLD